MKNLIKELREDRGMSLEHLAKLCDTNRQQLWKLETGATKLLEPWITRLATALRVQPRELFDEDLPADFHIFTPDELKQALADHSIPMSVLARTLGILPAMAQKMTKVHDDDGRPQRRISPNEQVTINKLLTGEIGDPNPPQRVIAAEKREEARERVAIPAQPPEPAPQQPIAAQPTARTQPRATILPPRQDSMVPVYPVSWEGVLDTQPAAYEPFPAQIGGVADVFATYAPSGDLFPHHKEGDLLFLARRIPPRPGDFVLVEGQDRTVCTRQYIGRERGEAIFRKFNPQEEERAPVSAIAGVYRILLTVPQ